MFFCIYYIDLLYLLGLIAFFCVVRFFDYIYDTKFPINAG